MCISALIVNWNSKEFLRKCLQTVKDTCNELVRQIIVVDAGSFDGCDKMLIKEFPHVEFIQCLVNVGFGLANNIGFERVKEEYLLLLNPDTELKPHAVASLLTALQHEPDAGIVAPRILNMDRSIQTSCVQALPTPFNQALDSEFLRKMVLGSRLWGIKKAFSASLPVEVEAVSGACMLLRSETFRKIGGFSPNYFMYVEDLDLCAKVRRLGLKVYHVPGATVIHYGGGSSPEKVTQFNTVMMRESSKTYLKLNRSSGSALLYRILQGLSATVRLQILFLMFLFGKSPRKRMVKDSIRKWSYVFMWSLGVLNIQTPGNMSSLSKTPGHQLWTRKDLERNV